MSGLFNLNKYVLASFLIDWLALKDFLRLDDSLCNHDLRKAFHALIATYSTNFQESLFKRNLSRYSEEEFLWHRTRGLSVTHLQMNKDANNVPNDHLSAQCSSLETLAIVGGVDVNVACAVIGAASNTLKELQCSTDHSASIVGEVVDLCSSLVRCSISSDRHFSNATLTQLCRRFGSQLQQLGLDECSTKADVWPIAIHCRQLQTLELFRVQYRQYAKTLEAYLLHCPRSSLVQCICSNWTYKGLRLYLYTLHTNGSHPTELNLTSVERLDDSLLGEIGALCPRLRKLSFPLLCNTVSDTAVTHLSSCLTELQLLHLEQITFVTDTTLIAIATHCPQLTDFALARTYNERVSSRGLQCLTSLGPRLKSLSLKHMGLTGETLLILLRHCSRLEELIVPGNPALSDEELVPAAALLSCVERLHLQEIPNLGNETLLAVAQHCGDLTSLHVGHVRCSVEDSGVLAVLRSCSRLRSLSLTQCYQLTSQSLLNIVEYAPRLSLLFIRIKEPVELSLLQRLVTEMKKLVLLSLNHMSQCTELEKFVGETRPELCFYTF